MEKLIAQKTAEQEKEVLEAENEDDDDSAKEFYPERVSLWLKHVTH